MTCVVVAGHRPRAGLNMRQLLNQIFFSPAVRHPDMKRQRTRRQVAKDRRAARVLKSAPVELRLVPPCTNEEMTEWRRNWTWKYGR